MNTVVSETGIKYRGLKVYLESTGDRRLDERNTERFDKMMMMMWKEYYGEPWELPKEMVSPEDANSLDMAGAKT